MKVKLRCRIPGHLLNEVVDLPDPQARLLVSQRQAVPVADDPTPVSADDTDDAKESSPAPDEE